MDSSKTPRIGEFLLCRKLTALIFLDLSDIPRFFFAHYFLGREDYHGLHKNRDKC